MARRTTSRSNHDRTAPEGEDEHAGHEHRTAKVVQLIGTSSDSFEDAVRAALEDAAETTRGITGCQVRSFSVKCRNGEIVAYKADLNVAFGIERT